MLKGFRDFILRGNAVDLGVGVVIGSAFGSLMSKFSDGVLQPLLKMASGGGVPNFDGTGLLSALISFLLVMGVIYRKTA